MADGSKLGDHMMAGTALRPFSRAEQIMGMPAAVRRSWTLAEVRALIDANPLATPRYELVDGELLVTPSPIGPHQKAVRELLVALATYLRQNPVGEVLDSPFDIELEPETIVQPDVFVVPPDEARRLDNEMPGRTLLLAIEVISPSSARGDRGPKRALFQRHVPEYWIIDLDARLLERWRPGDTRPEILHTRIEWQPAGITDPFVLDLADFFARVTPGIAR
jgi:Uma2 family endonuclease